MLFTASNVIERPPSGMEVISLRESKYVLRHHIVLVTCIQHGGLLTAEANCILVCKVIVFHASMTISPRIKYSETLRQLFSVPAYPFFIRRIYSEVKLLPF